MPAKSCGSRERRNHGAAVLLDRRATVKVQMKRKLPSPQAPVVDDKILEEAKLALETDKLNLSSRCVVCGSPCAPNSAEGLCWVCRRLKISAWRDSDQQAAAQE